MKYVAFDEPGGPETLHVAEMPEPKAAGDEILIAVDAAGVCRADTLQRRGLYPPPPGSSPVLGMEVAGTVAAVGENARRWRVGDRVCALCNGGGYAQYVAVPHGQSLPLPERWSAIEAASLPENAFTVYDNVFTRAGLRAGETLLVHGGSSGIGTLAIQFANALGARAIATAGSKEKVEACLALGAVAAIDYKQRDFVEETLRITDGRGVDVVLDMVGGDYIARDLSILAMEGRLVCIATQRGSKAEIDLGRMLQRRLTILGSTLRARTVDEKAFVATNLEREIWPLLAAKQRIEPVIDTVFSFEDASAAHKRMESSEHIGKIVLVP